MNTSKSIDVMLKMDDNIAGDVNFEERKKILDERVQKTIAEFFEVIYESLKQLPEVTIRSYEAFPLIQFSGEEMQVSKIESEIRTRCAHLIEDIECMDNWVFTLPKN